MKRRYRLLTVLGLLGLLPTIASGEGAQQDTPRYGAVMGYRVVNQLIIDGERIETLHGVRENWQVEVDKNQGEAYVTPFDETPLTLFITTENHQRYVVDVAVVMDKGSEVVVIKPKSALSKPIVSSEKEEITTFLVQLKAQSKTVPAPTISRLHAETPLRKRARETLLFTTTQGHLQGRVVAVDSPQRWFQRHAFSSTRVAVAWFPVTYEGSSGFYVMEVSHV